MNIDNKLDTGEMNIKKNGFLAWLDNFWYHYKWHSLIALFLVFTVTICTFQMCQKESYDAHILFAGSHAFSRDSADGDFPEYNKAKISLERFVKDYDENGDVNISFRALFVPSDDELGKLDESQFQLAYSDKSALSSTMMTGDYFICFFSPSIYEKYKAVGSEDSPEIFADLSQFVPEGVSIEYYNGEKSAILLSSTDIYSLSGLSAMPEDTVICLRNLTFSTHLNKKANEKAFTKSKEILTKILAYQENN